MEINTLKSSGVEPTEERTDYKFSDDESISPWVKESVYIAYANGILNGIGNDEFNPKGSATKEQVITIFTKVLRDINYNPIEHSNSKIRKI